MGAPSSPVSRASGSSNVRIATNLDAHSQTGQCEYPIAQSIGPSQSARLSKQRQVAHFGLQQPRILVQPLTSIDPRFHSATDDSFYCVSPRCTIEYKLACTSEYRHLAAVRHVYASSPHVRLHSRVTNRRDTDSRSWTTLYQMITLTARRYMSPLFHTLAPFSVCKAQSGLLNPSTQPLPSE
jgi:hypothetical protein